MMDCELYAYVAGIIDGEGSVSIIHKSNGYLPVIQMSMRTPTKVPKWLHDRFGGSYGEYRQGSHAWGSGYTAKWAISGFSALDLLRCIQPYIIEKSEVVDLMLQFPMVGKHHTISAEDMEARVAICELIQKLNKKSKPRNTQV